MKFRIALRVGIAVTILTTSATVPARGDTGDITLLGSRSLPGSVRITDVWGYHDALAGREYAIVGDQAAGVFIVDVTDPDVMTIAFHITGVPGFDVKVWDHYIYSCDGDGDGTDSRIIDIADPAHPVVSPNTFESAHNIAINANGVMFLEVPGMRVYTLGADPLVPQYHYRAGKFGHDATPAGNLLYDFTGSVGAVNIWRVSNPARPVLLGTVSGTITYAHSGDATSDGNWLYVCDELSVHPIPDISVWNIADPAAPVRVTDIADATATVHNLYIVDDLAFVSYYTSGFKVFDVSDPASPVLADQYDTSGYTGEGYDGAFGVYPYAPSGNIYVSDHPNGLYVFGVERGTATPVAITAFEALAAGGGVDLSWDLFADEPFSGFRIRREEHGGPSRTIASNLDARTRRHRDAAVEPGRRYDYTLVALGTDGEEVAAIGAGVETPRVTMRLLPNYPNPFNPSTTIAFDLERSGTATLAVYNAHGRQVRSLVHARLRAGRHEVVWDGTADDGGSVASGTYFVRLITPGGVLSRRVTLVK